MGYPMVEYAFTRPEPEQRSYDVHTALEYGVGFLVDVLLAKIERSAPGAPMQSFILAGSACCLVRCVLAHVGTRGVQVVLFDPRLLRCRVWHVVIEPAVLDALKSQLEAYILQAIRGSGLTIDDIRLWG